MLMMVLMMTVAAALFAFGVATVFDSEVLPTAHPSSLAA